MIITFSFDLCDADGDVYEKCLMLHIDNNLILKLNDVSDLDNMIVRLKLIRQEIKDTFGK